jgi:FAD/FMN-containing dehydrogenase
MAGVDPASADLSAAPYPPSELSALSADLKHTPTEALRAALEACSVPSRSPLAAFTNWARTFECRPQRVFAPTTALECRQIVELARRDGATVHPVGVGHSPSDLGCTNGWLVRMEGVQGTLEVSTSYQ